MELFIILSVSAVNGILLSGWWRNFKRVIQIILEIHI